MPVTLDYVHEGDWAAVQRLVDKLTGVLIDTGGLSLRLRAGSVAANGAIISGTGFSVNKTGTGTYTITVGFTTAPSVIPGLGVTAGLTGIAVSPAPSTTSFGISTFNAGGLVDGAFHWIAVGT